MAKFDRAKALDSAMEIISSRADLARSGGTLVPSPCISVCRMDAASGLCEGCFRTLDEICQWSGASPQGKRQVWNLIEQRMAAHAA
jgi:predicted Fe-S protein YdhL (DUF1289 family)